MIAPRCRGKGAGKKFLHDDPLVRRAHHRSRSSHRLRWWARRMMDSRCREVVPAPLPTLQRLARYERPRERDEACDRNVLRAFGRRDAGVAEQCERITSQRFEALPEHLATLAERRLGDTLQRAAGAGERL